MQYRKKISPNAFNSLIFLGQGRLYPLILITNLDTDNRAKDITEQSGDAMIQEKNVKKGESTIAAIGTNFIGTDDHVESEIKYTRQRKILGHEDHNKTELETKDPRY